MFVTLQGGKLHGEVIFISGDIFLIIKENSGKFESVSIDFEIQLDSWKYL